ncbi:MAG: diguanylate cyclase [Acetobacter sp.]|nr:diguanylate cyclase [Bacteroides sp.]MCM1340183.1 diguanylate cyclase [Acetobacter sp.]MCM1432865.1 diguanylate cyclase [Clostridiales bacterium]
MQKNTKYKILIVDDSVMNRTILADILEDNFEILEASDGIEAIQMIKKYNNKLSLILLDLVMPNMDGLEVLAVMNSGEWINNIPVIMISSENSPTYVERAYELGATDFINRPFNAYVVRKRIANTIMLYTKQRNLIDLVSQQVYEKEKTNNLMINILSHIVEFRNGESGLHILHVNTITEALLKSLVKKTDKYNLSYNDIATIVIASSLHDIGKISIPDEILNKPGKLTPEEFEIIKTHSETGASMLSSMTEYLDEPLVSVAREICLYHHERYDGKGYPTGISGDDIPISAQVVSIADVYDALTSERCYKDAIPPKKALQMIKNGECGCFNPILIECLEDVSDFLVKELKINSYSKKHLNEVKKITNEMLVKNEFSVLDNSINYLEQERIKYEFFASISQEIQFEYTVSPSILTISEWCAEKFNLPVVIVNPLKNEKLINFISQSVVDLFKTEIKKTSHDSPVSQFTIEININNELRMHRVYCRANWSYDDEPKILSVIGKIVDIEDEYQKMQSLEKKAATDTLTNLYNHKHAKELINNLLNKTEKNYAMIIFDLDNFKYANDTHGHMFGDRVLKSVADTLTKISREEDISARIGGDEFLIFIEYRDVEILKNIVKRIHGQLNNIKCDAYNVMVSAGIATTEQTGYNYDDLFNDADCALYYSKENGKGEYTFHDKNLNRVNVDITPIEN